MPYAAPSPEISSASLPALTSSPSSPEAGVLALCEAVRIALAEALATASTATSVPAGDNETPLARLHSVRQDCATAIALLPRKNLQSPALQEARRLVKVVSESGIHDSPTSAADLSLARRLAAEFNGGPGLISAMLLTSAWQWPEAPTLSRVPDDLWGDFTAWTFTPTLGFCAPGQTDAFAAHTLRHLEDLAMWTSRNPGSATVRVALEAYMLTASAIPLYFTHDSLRAHAELRGRLLTKAAGAHRDTYDPLAEFRLGRRLRVGFVNRHFGPQTETYTTLPTFEQLDTERFEVHLFAHQLNDSPLESYAQDHAQFTHVLPEDFSAQLAMLREAQLDVIVFGTNVTAVFNQVARLALYRSAPLQVVNNSSCITSGFAHVDLYVSGSLTETAEAPAHFSERLGLLPGPAHAFNYEADRQEPTTHWTREGLGIPENAVLFVTAANYFKIIPEMQHAWAKLLSTVPEAYLLVHPFNPNWSSSYPVERFCAEFDRVLAAHGVDPARLRVSTERFQSRADVKALLNAGDIYLDTSPFGGVNSLIDPLELGIPTIAWEGKTFRSRMGAALLRQLGLEELIATSETAYLEIASRLARESTTRLELRLRIERAMERTPIFLDPLASSDAFGDLLESAFDTMADQGTAAFRADRTPIRAAAATPLDAPSRHQRGVELLSAGRTARAADYLTAAVQQDEANPKLWYDIAKTFRTAGQLQPAIQALETSLRLDASRAEAWIMLVELAEGVGSTELAREALGCAMELAPTDARVLQLAARSQAA